MRRGELGKEVKLWNYERTVSVLASTVVPKQFEAEKRPQYLYNALCINFELRLKEKQNEPVSLVFLSPLYDFIIIFVKTSCRDQHCMLSPRTAPGGWLHYAIKKKHPCVLCTHTDPSQCKTTCSLAHSLRLYHSGIFFHQLQTQLRHYEHRSEDQKAHEHHSLRTRPFSERVFSHLHFLTFCYIAAVQNYLKSCFPHQSKLHSTPRIDKAKTELFRFTRIY